MYIKKTISILLLCLCSNVPLAALGHIETAQRPHPTDWCPFGVKNISVSCILP